MTRTIHSNHQVTVKGTEEELAKYLRETFIPFLKEPPLMSEQASMTIQLTLTNKVTE